jgi:Txe/YoeB family toxin of Txe-Axe toxin-antitoxin module
MSESNLEPEAFSESEISQEDISERDLVFDRIVYVVSDDRIEFIQARYHYSDR